MTDLVKSGRERSRKKGLGVIYLGIPSLTADGFGGDASHLHVVHIHDVSTVVHVLLQILVLRERIAIVSHRHHQNTFSFTRQQPYQVLKDEHEALVSVDNVVQRDDVGVFEVLQ